MRRESRRALKPVWEPGTRFPLAMRGFFAVAPCTGFLKIQPMCGGPYGIANVVLDCEVTRIDKVLVDSFLQIQQWQVSIQN